MSVDPAWILALMIELEPGASYRDTYPATAAAIVAAAERAPLPDLDEKDTAALVVAVAWYESRFQIDAMGDCTAKGSFALCKAPDAVPHSFCALQINETNFKAYGTSRAEVLGSVERCVAVGLRIMRDSFRVCAREKPEDRMAHYAGGGSVCVASDDARRKGRHRVALGARLARR